MPGTASGSRRPTGTATSCPAGTTSSSSFPMASGVQVDLTQVVLEARDAVGRAA